MNKIVTTDLNFATWLSQRDDVQLRSISNIGLSRVLYRYRFDSTDHAASELYAEWMKTKLYDYMAQRKLLKNAPDVCVK